MNISKTLCLRIDPSTLQKILFVNPILVIFCGLHNIQKHDFTICRAVPFASLFHASYQSVDFAKYIVHKSFVNYFVQSPQHSQA